MSVFQFSDSLPAFRGHLLSRAPGLGGVLAAHLFVFIAGAVGVLMLGDPSARVAAAKTLQRWSTDHSYH